MDDDHYLYIGVNVKFSFISLVFCFSFFQLKPIFINVIEENKNIKTIFTLKKVCQAYWFMAAISIIIISIQKCVLWF